VDRSFRQTVGHLSWTINVNNIDAIFTKHLQPTDLEIYFGGGMYIEDIQFSNIVPVVIQNSVIEICKNCASSVNFQYREAIEKEGLALTNKLYPDCYRICFDKRTSLRQSLHSLGFYPKIGSPFRKLKNADQESIWDTDLQQFNVMFVIEAFAYRPKS